MSIKTLYKTVNDKGEYSCGDIGISAEEWLQLLKHPDAEPYFNTLCCFLREPDHTGTCTAIAKKYGNTYEHYNAKITNFAKWAQKKLNRFQVIATDGSETFWCIPMQKGWKTRQGFNWQLREELVEALQNFLMEGLINLYQKNEPFNGYDEEYKWELLDKTEGKGTLDIIRSLQEPKINLVYSAQFNSVMKYLSDNEPDMLTTIVEHLFDESKDINVRIASFKADMKSICPKDWKNFANDERTASALLMCKYPAKYTTYKDEVYQRVCQYFGINSKEVGKKFIHFMAIINRFVANFGEKVQEIMMPQIGQFRNKPKNLAIQTVFWCMKDYMKDVLDNNYSQEENRNPLIEEDMPQQKYKEYIELLKEAHNLVITGAPGTGKTRMAKEIAKEMGAVTKFVQFHPSYDYTDFVEGLRPVDKAMVRWDLNAETAYSKSFVQKRLNTIQIKQLAKIQIIPLQMNYIVVSFGVFTHL